MKQRVATAFIAIPVVLASLLLTTTWPLAVLCVAAAAIASTELNRIYARSLKGFSPPSPALIAAAAFLILGDSRDVRQIALAILWPLFFVGVRSAITLAQGKRVAFLRVFATGWIYAPLLAVVLIHRSGAGQEGWISANWILLLFVPIWAGDTAAIFVGRTWGKRLLAPKISPNKTWEGAAANLAFCILAGIALAPIVHVAMLKGVACGLACGVFGQVGDLLESALKRSADFKDSGSLLPGHGGMLDRIDSLLFAALPVATILLLL